VWESIREELVITAEEHTVNLLKRFYVLYRYIRAAMEQDKKMKMELNYLVTKAKHESGFQKVYIRTLDNALVAWKQEELELMFKGTKVDLTRENTIPLVQKTS
jgi:hypothetical protein